MQTELPVGGIRSMSIFCSVDGYLLSDTTSKLDTCNANSLM